MKKYDASLPYRSPWPTAWQAHIATGCLLLAGLGCDSSNSGSVPASGSQQRPQKAAEAASTCKTNNDLGACAKACDLEKEGGQSCLRAYRLTSVQLRGKRQRFRQGLGKRGPALAELKRFESEVADDVIQLGRFATRACSVQRAEVCRKASELIQSLLAQRVPNPNAAIALKQKLDAGQAETIHRPWLKMRDELMLKSCERKHQPGCTAAARHWLGRDNKKAAELLAGSKDTHGRHWLKQSQAAKRRCDLGQARGCIEDAAIVFAADRARLPLKLDQTYRRLALGPPLSKSLLTTVVKVRGLGLLPHVGGKQGADWARDDRRPPLQARPDSVTPATPKILFDSARIAGKDIKDALQRRVGEKTRELQGCWVARPGNSSVTPDKGSQTFHLGFWVDGHGSPFNLSARQRREPFWRCLFDAIASKRLTARGPASVVLRLKLQK